MSWHINLSVFLNGKPRFSAAFNQSPVTLGADPENDVVLSDPFVSGRHAEILVSRGRLVVRDHSTNGSYFGGRKVLDEEILGLEGTVSIPPFDVTLELVQDTDVRRTSFRTDLSALIAEARTEGDDTVARSTAAAVVAPPPLPPPPPAPRAEAPVSASAAVVASILEEPDWASTLLTPEIASSLALASVEIVEAPEEIAQKEHPILENPTRLGRADDAEVRIPIPSVSRHHAAIERLDDGSYQITDLGSSNSTLLNGQRVGIAPLHEGDELRLGEVRLVFHGPPRPPRERTPVRASIGGNELEISIQEIGGAVHVANVAGRIDSYNYTRLADTLDRAIDDGVRFLVVDLSAVDFIGHAGLGIFVKCLARLTKQRGDLRLAGMNDRILDAMSLSRLDTLFKGRLAARREDVLREWVHDGGPSAS